jgi:hypothetical protein
MDTNYFSLPTDLAFLLEHQYNESSLSFNGLRAEIKRLFNIYERLARSAESACIWQTSNGS